MADKKNTIALEIGAQSISMGVFSLGKKGLVLNRYARRDVLLDPVEEGLRIEYVSAALAELVSELNVKGKDVHNVISGQQVFIRFIKLPSIVGEDMDQLVAFEAQQQIPFPMDEIIWDYQLLSDGYIGDREVLLVAVKKEHLDNLNGQVAANGLQTKSVDCSITALFNAYKHSCPMEHVPVMILDIGAKTTDIIFCAQNRFYTRSATVAGAYVTNAISRELHVTFKDAEKLKIRRGVISMTGGHTDSMSEQDAALATVIRTAMSRLSAEIQRTINRYRTEFQGEAPVKAYLCGGGSLLTFTPEFMQEMLGIPVEYLNPFNNIAIGANVDESALETEAVLLGGVVGAAARAAGESEFSIDLVPTSVARERSEKQLLPKVVAAGLAAVIGAGVFAGLSYRAARNAEVAAQPIERHLTKAEEYRDHIDLLEEKLRNRGRMVDNFSDLATARYAYADILKLLAEKTSSLQFWLTEFSPLINYDPSTKELVGGLSGTPVIDRNRSANANVSDTALVDPPEDIANKNRKKKPDAVTAIYIEGYTLKKDTTQQHRQVIHDIIKAGLEQDSPFTFEGLSENQYITFVASDSKDQKVIKVPDYADKFLMVLPLKQPLPLPSATGAAKAGK